MGRTSRSRKRRAVLDFRGAQLGDSRNRDIAGGNIYNGVSPEHVVALIHEVIGDQRQFRELELREREIRDAAITTSLSDLRAAIEHSRGRGESIDDELDKLRKAVKRITADIGQYREIGISADSKLVAWIRAKIKGLQWKVIGLAVGGMALAVVFIWHLWGKGL